MSRADILAALPALPLAASALAGIAIGMVVYALAAAVASGTQPVTAALDDAQQRIRRERANRDSSLFGVAMTLMPVLVPIARGLRLDSLRASLAARYARAGWPGGLDDDEVLAMSLLVGLVLTAPLTLVIAVINPLAAPAALVGVVLGPGLVSSSLNRRGNERELALSRSMPYVLDLLVLTVRAGAPLPVAMQRVSSDWTGHPIGDEFKSTLTDMEMGVTTHDAFRNLAERAAVEEVKTFVEDLLQSEELGRPVADALARLADRARIRRVQEATETAGRAKVLVLVPGMLVFLATLLLLFAPFIVRYFYGGFGV